MSETGTGMSLLVRIDDARYALPIAGIVEILRPLLVAPVADAPDFVAGLAIVRGEPIPIVTLNQRQEAQAALTRRFVVLRVGRRRVGLLIDAVIGLRSLDHHSLRPLPAVLKQLSSVIESIGTLDGELFLVLDSARVVPEDLIDRSIHGIAS